MVGVFLHSSKACYMLVLDLSPFFINVLTIVTADSTLPFERELPGDMDM